MKVHFDFDRRAISIEGQEPELVELLKLVREIAPKLPQITISIHSIPVSNQTVANDQKGGSLAAQASNQSMRQFARSLSLSNAAERIAALAYYGKHIEGKETFSPKEMSATFMACGFQSPAQMPVAVFDAKKRYGYIESAGRAKWRITTSGENLIVGKTEESKKE